MTRLIFILVLLLMVFPEVSLQTSFVFNRELTYTPWQIKFFDVIGIPDLIVISTAIFLGIRSLRRVTLHRNEFDKVLIFSLIYLLLGLTYNLFIYSSWKTYVYDIKSVMFVTVFYYLFNEFKYRKEIYWFTPKNIFWAGLFAAMLDTFYVHNFGTVEYPEFLGFPATATVLYTPILFYYAYFAEGLKDKLLYGIVFVYEIVSLVNKLTLSVIYYTMCAPIYIVAYSISKNSRMRLMLLSTVFIFTDIVGPVVIIYTPFGILNAKEDGLVTRKIQWDNFLENAKINYPILIGKGAGATWFEITPIPEADIYSYGTSVGGTAEDSRDSPVKFIFNVAPAGILHKWGIFGALTAILLIISFVLAGVKKNYKWNLNSKMIFFSALYLGLQNILFLGILKASLLAAIFLFWSFNTNLINKKNTHI